MVLAVVGLSNPETITDAPEPPREVLPGVELDRSPEAVLHRAEDARRQNPDNPEVLEILESLRAQSEDFVEGTKESANMLEDLGEEVIKGLVGASGTDPSSERPIEDGVETDQPTSASEEPHEPSPAGSSATSND